MQGIKQCQKQRMFSPSSSCLTLAWVMLGWERRNTKKGSYGGDKFWKEKKIKSAMAGPETQVEDGRVLD